MSLERAGALALAIGAVFYIALMAVHPSHGGGDPVFLSFSLSGVVHAVALTLKPILVFGFVVLTGRLGFDKPLPLLALSFYGLAALFTMLAGTMSGLMFPKIIEAAHTPGADVESMQAFARYTTWLNRSFAQVHFDLASVAILLWGIAWPRRGVFGWIVSIAGIAVGVAVLGWQLSGGMNFEARQGALHITLLHGIWTLLAAAWLFHAKRE